MPILGNQLELERCPHCNVDRPSLTRQWVGDTTNYSGQSQRTWVAYSCSRCGGVVTAWSDRFGNDIREVFPPIADIDISVPQPARSYLIQALNSKHSPSGAVMLSASAVDAMLKLKNYKDGSLFTRINKAAEDHLITQDMAGWAHKVRLDANDQRHADDEVVLPNHADGLRSIEFASALAQFLFVLPSRVTRGLEESKPIG